jgi:hypothetical protein
MLLMKPELVARLDTPDGLRRALEQAIKLEHATLPPYLYAMFSLMPGSNVEIASLLHGIVMEEMGHMALACNLLNAVGGSPQISTPEAIPTYPGPLPGTVEGQLTVNLAAFSIEHVRDTFMVIEAPEEPIVFEDAVAEKPLTIGEFYALILAAIKEASPSVFVDPPRRQVVGVLPGVIAVTNLASATTAIETIVEQGEGTKTSPVGDKDAELAHYYRFEEIAEGKKLVPDATKKPPWTFDPKQPIPFEATKVYPAMCNPKTEAFPAGSQVRRECEAFNRKYTIMLELLHETFNGTDKLSEAIGLMETLKAQARVLMTMPSGVKAGKNAGPSFEYQPG